MKHKITNSTTLPRPLFIDFNSLGNDKGLFYKRGLISLTAKFYIRLQESFDCAAAFSNPKILLDALHKSKIIINILNDPELTWIANQIQIVCLTDFTVKSVQQKLDEMGEIIEQIKESIRIQKAVDLTDTFALSNSNPQ